MLLKIFPSVLKILSGPKKIEPKMIRIIMLIIIERNPLGSLVFLQSPSIFLYLLIKYCERYPINTIVSIAPSFPKSVPFVIGFQIPIISPNMNSERK